MLFRGRTRNWRRCCRGNVGWAVPTNVSNALFFVVVGTAHPTRDACDGNGHRDATRAAGGGESCQRTGDRSAGGAGGLSAVAGGSGGGGVCGGDFCRPSARSRSPGVACRGRSVSGGLGDLPRAPVR